MLTINISRLYMYNKIFLYGFLFRLVSTLCFVLIEIKIIAIIYYAAQKEKENEQLRFANATMELELLKGQINPHFLFNTLSSLSAIIRENPEKAQSFVTHLSKMFRHSLSGNSQHLITLDEELRHTQPYIELMKMRMESGFQIINNIPEIFYDRLLPQTSLLPLIENALNHNAASSDKPLTIIMNIQNDELIIDNNIQPKTFPEKGTGIGLSNLNERFRILMQKEIDISKTGNHFIIKLPLKK